jgi:hypothetical protein
MKQINLKLPDGLFEAARNYTEHFGFRNLQELAAQAIREKIFEKNEYDESLTNKEIELIDKLISSSIKEKTLVSEDELNKILLE